MPAKRPLQHNRTTSFSLYLPVFMCTMCISGMIRCTNDHENLCCFVLGDIDGKKCSIYNLLNSLCLFMVQIFLFRQSNKAKKVILLAKKVTQSKY